MGLLSGFARSKLASWAGNLAPGSQMSRRAWATVTYTPKGETEGTDISEDLMQYLLSIEYTDNIADAVDDLTLTLEDKTGLWQSSWFPDPGAKLTVTLNTYNNKNLSEGLQQLELGTFEIDQIEVSAMPSTVQIKAVATSLDSTLRGAKNNRSWDDTTVQTVANDLAAVNSLQVEWYCEENPALGHIEQSDESDLAFLRKLCKDNGFNLKVTDKSLVIYDEQQLESGEALVLFKHPTLPASLPIYAVNLASKEGNTTQATVDSFISYKFTAKTRDVYKACHVAYKKGQDKQVIESTFTAPDKTSGKTLEVSEQCDTQAEADRLAKKKLREQNKDEVACSFSLQGDFMYWAGEVIEIRGYGHFDGRYIITKAVHHMGSGYTVDLDLRRCLDGY